MKSIYDMMAQAVQAAQDARAMHEQYAKQATEQFARVDILTAKVDLLLTARIKAGEVTADMVQATDMPEATKTELTDQIAAEGVAATT